MRCCSSARPGASRCHAVSGQSNEMFSDFREHVLAVPQVVPRVTNVAFDGPGAERGLRPRGRDRRSRPTATRSAPLRCATSRSSRPSCTTAPSPRSRRRSPITSTSSPLSAATTRRGRASPTTLRARSRRSGRCCSGSIPSLASPLRLTKQELRDLVAFVRDGLLDPRARPEQLRHLIPDSVPSGAPALRFECPQVAGLSACARACG